MQSQKPLIFFDPHLEPGCLDYSLVLFLDVDGVLHPDRTDPSNWFCFALRFCDALQIADPQGVIPIVISSEWRLDTSLADLKGRFTPDVARRIVGVTPNLDLPSSTSLGWATGHRGSHLGLRQREIEAWMADYAPAGKWVAVDDHRDGFRADCGDLILVEHHSNANDVSQLPSFCEVIDALADAQRDNQLELQQ